MRWAMPTTVLLVLAALSCVASLGQRQSPIDLMPAQAQVARNNNGNLLQIHLGSAPGTLVHKGNTVQVDWSAGPKSRLVLDGNSYKALQLHFHAGSDHRVNGHQFPLEMHIVHQSVTDPTQLAVVGVLFEVSTHMNPFLTQFFPLLPQHPSGKMPPIKQLRGKLLGIHRGHQFYRYSGSLTAGNFSENVEWVVLSTPQPISHEQLDTYLRLFPKSSARDTQPLHGRVVTLVEL
ncbi:hypothetical protein AaE_014208 [Aphanomyces astaci]|uniref:carbonic anhydrase n=1 Tax=Aphanomyces astaci TaxID=112090 RepID=A0A6A4Z7X2_APHAT|nr:hypothetical protein AaE_014208 [Aphanomyces astaci]